MRSQCGDTASQRAKEHDDSCQTRCSREGKQGVSLQGAGRSGALLARKVDFDRAIEFIARRKVRKVPLFKGLSYIRRKGKETPFILRIASKSSDMDHTVLPANYTMPAFPS